MIDESQILKFSRMLASTKWKYLLQAEREGVRALLPQYPGFYLTQLGVIRDLYDLKSFSTIRQHLYAGPFDKKIKLQSSTIVTLLADLPFLAESIDLFFLPHTLEFTTSPRRLLNEIYHSLISGGKLVILGFNPFSVVGLTKLLKSAKNDPWFGSLRSPLKLKRWLTHCGFSIEHQDYLDFRAFSKHQKKTTEHTFFRSLFKKGHSSGVYLFIAEKKSITMSPLKIQKISRNMAVPSGYPEPSAKRVSYP